VAFDAQITSAEIDAVLRQSAAGRTTLIASSAHSGRFTERATSGGYEAIASCAENQFDMDGQELSLFMEALLPKLKPDVTGKTLAQATRTAMGDAVTFQEPQFAVDDDRPPFVGRNGGDASASGGATLAQVMLGVTAAVSTETLDQIAALVAHGDIPETTAPALAAEWWRRGELDRLGKLHKAFTSTSPVIACAAASAAARGATATEADLSPTGSGVQPRAARRVADAHASGSTQRRHCISPACGARGTVGAWRRTPGDEKRA
jgi:hypothetical protein